MNNLANTNTSILGFLGLAIASFLGCIDLTIVTSVLPVIAQQLHTIYAQAEIALSVFLAALAMFMVSAGRLADQKGRKEVLIIGLIIFILGSISAALSTSINTLIISRFIQGASCAILYTSTTTLVEALFSPSKKSQAIGRLYSINAIGLAIGPVLGTILIPLWNWQAIFWINVPFGILSLILITAFVPKVAQEPVKNNDFFGQFFLALIVFLLMILLQIKPLTWENNIIWILSFIIIIGIVLGTIIESKAQNPIIDVKLFKNKQFRGAVISDFLLAFFYASALLIIPGYLVYTLKYSENINGLFLLLVSVTMAIISTQIGKLIDLITTSKVLIIGFIGLIISGIFLVTGLLSNQIIIFSLGLIVFGASWAAVLTQLLYKQ